MFDPDWKLMRVTTRDDGATWDETRWAFDPASGVNTAKEYADGSRISYAYTDNGQPKSETIAPVMNAAQPHPEVEALRGL